MYSTKNIDAYSMEKLSKSIAIDMRLITVLKDNKLKVLTDEITEEKKSYLNLVFLKKYEIERRDKVLIEKLLKGYYLNIKDKNFDELENLLIRAIKKNSSDIHIEPYENFSQIRIRIDGSLEILNKVSKQIYNKLVNKIKVLGNLDIAKKLEPQDGKLKFNYENFSYDIRISTMPTVNGEKIVLRILYKDKNLINLNNLSFNEKQKTIIYKLLALNNGLVLVNGPTGSGKSTTLYSFINYYDKERKNIATVEDPVEFNIEGIIQSNINEKIGFTFSKALKNLLRQDPDIILIGEIRDEETAKIAVRAAITGHKVLGTIHTNRAKDVYYRLVDMGVEPYLLKQCLKGAISQRLMRRLCANCKEKVKVKNPFINKEEETLVYRAKGCNDCYGLGYRGRIMVAEVLDFENINLEKLERDNKQTIINSAEELLKKGEISLDDYLVFREGELVSEG